MAGSTDTPAASIGQPLWLLAELTYRCPLHCVFCYNPVQLKQASSELTTAEWVEVMRQARQRIAKGGSVIRTSVSTFMEFIGNNPNAFRLLLRERSGTSAAFRAAVAREIQHFIAELADYLELENHMPRAFTEAQAEAMVTIVFSAGAEALDVGAEQRRQLEERLVLQLRMIATGAFYWYRREKEKLTHNYE